jgi:hypothetical protein
LRGHCSFPGQLAELGSLRFDCSSIEIGGN